ncbi:MAG TPA: hypothetical protein VFO91_00775 [Anaerolineales bacterium]|nr:hypothetical protein [Anaerolineales bacterium]
MMKVSKAVILLAWLVALLSIVYASIGLFLQEAGSPFTFTTIRGTTVEIYGQGLYRYDSAFKAPILRGTDAVTLFICVPVLLIAVLLYRRGSLRGGLLLTSILAYFLYNSASLAFGAAYNNLLLVYIVSFSASLFGFILAFDSIDLQALARHTSARFPRRGIAIFLFLAGLSLIVWLLDIVSALAAGTVPPNLGPYTTEATYVIDLGIIFPTAFLAGVLVWRRASLGTLLACILMTLNASIGLVVASQSIMQALEGIVLTPSEFAAYVAPFVTLSLIATWLVILLFRSISSSKAA